MKNFVNKLKEMANIFVMVVKKVLTDKAAIISLTANIVLNAIAGPTLLVGAIIGLVEVTVIVVVICLLATIGIYHAQKRMNDEEVESVIA